jgi:hypothetical protein
MDAPSESFSKPSSLKTDVKKAREAFSAIVSFVEDLWEVFGNAKVVNALSLYHRLIQNIKISDEQSITKTTTGFKSFFNNYDTLILENKLDSVPKGTLIKYGESEKIYIDIQKFIYKTKSDPSTRETLRQHLLTISMILAPDKSKMTELEKRMDTGLKIDTSSREGAFIKKVMDKAKSSMESVSMDNPMEAMMTIFKSGVLQDMVGGLQQGVGSGEMSMEKLLSTMQGAIGSILPTPTVAAPVETSVDEKIEDEPKINPKNETEVEDQE